MAKETTKPPANGCPTCGQSRVLRFKNFEFFWTEDSNMTINELPEETVLEIHPTFIIMDAKDNWRILVPMDRIRCINISNPV